MVDGVTELWNLPMRLRGVVESELNPGEQVVWIGRPSPTMSMWGTLPIVLFGIPWTAFALFWMTAASGFKMPNLEEGFQPEMLFPLFGLPFVLAGLAMLSAPFWVWISARRSAYLLTDQRVVFFTSFWNTTIQSLRLGQITELHRTQRSDGSGDLMLGRRMLAHVSPRSNARSATSVPNRFVGVPDVKRVESLVQTLLDLHRARNDSEE